MHLHTCLYIFIYIYIYIYIYTPIIYDIYANANLPVNAIARLPHPRTGDSQGQETFLAPSADKQTRNCGIECSNHMYILYIYICTSIYI